jgi:hypothetical protein
MRYSAFTNGFYAKGIEYGSSLPPDCVDITDEEHALLLEGQKNGKILTADQYGYPILIDPIAPTPMEIAQAQQSIVRKYLNDGAAEKHYDSITTACSYVASANNEFQNDAIACVAWRDDCWEHYLVYLDGVNLGAPVWSDSDLIRYLPKLVWPTSAP